MLSPHPITSVAGALQGNNARKSWKSCHTRLGGLVKRLQEIEPEFREVEEENRKRPGRLMNAQRGLTRLDVDWRAYNK